MTNRIISWSAIAVKQFESAIRYIAADSSINAERVSEDLINELNKTLSNPKFFPSDKYKLNNDGSYRAFEKHRYRISFRIHNNVIRILRVRHTSREPKSY